MNYTKHYQIPQPGYDDDADIKVIADAFEIIDNELKNANNNVMPIPYGQEVEREEGKLYIVETVKDSKEIVNADAVAYLRMTAERKEQAYSYYDSNSAGTENIHIQNSSRQIGAVSFPLPCAKKYVKKLILTFERADYSTTDTLNLFPAPAFQKTDYSDLISAAPTALNCTWSGYENEYDKNAILKTLTPTAVSGTTKYTVDLTEYLDSITDSNGKVNLILSAAGDSVNSTNWVRLYPDVSEYTVDVGYNEITGYSLEDCQGKEIDLSSDSATYYGTCNTAAATTAKVVECDGFTLKEGATIHVKFNNQNTATNATLNVNDTGAIPIRCYGTSSIPTYFWRPGGVKTFVYDGTYWVITEGQASTTYYGVVKLTSLLNNTSESYALTQKAGYDLLKKIEGAIESINKKSDFSGNYSDLTDAPESLKNPYALYLNGKTYDGSEEVDVGYMVSSFAVSLGEGETAYTLSEYTEPGVYSFDIPSGNSKCFTDSPSDVPLYGATMDVSRSTFSSTPIILQKLFVNDGGVPSTSPCIYVRSGVTDSAGKNWFSEWRKMIDNKDLDELKKSVSDGKEKVAAAITEMGVETTSAATFETMATNIGNIVTGKKHVSSTDAGVNINISVQQTYVSLQISGFDFRPNNVILKVCPDSAMLILTSFLDSNDSLDGKLLKIAPTDLSCMEYNTVIAKAVNSFGALFEIGESAGSFANILRENLYWEAWE